MMGFGAGVIALPILSHFISVQDGSQLVVFSSLCISLIIISRQYKNIVWSAWIKIIIISGIGLPLGVFIISSLSEFWITMFLVAFVIGEGIYGLFKTFVAKNGEQPITKVKYAFHIVILFIGGIIQGSLGVSGPLITVYVSDVVKDKSAFRATLCMTWVVLNGVLTIKNVTLDIINGTTIFPLMLAVIPAVIFSYFIGNHFHNKFSRETFNKFVYVFLIVIGVVTFFTTI
jgi:uncharacterized membrane protein YfcA